MLATKSVGYSALLALVLLLQATLQTPVCALDFEGDYTRSSVSPSVCVATSSCDYKCSASYTITVSGSTATMYPTANPPRCACETLTATISGNTARGSGSVSTYSLRRTSTGLEVVASVSGVVCTGTYTSAGSSSIASTAPASTTIDDSATNTRTTSGTTQASGHMGVLGWAIAASSAFVLCYF